jgi:exosortase/archaeosortase family protein
MQNDTQILALNGIPCNINYSCLGLGVMSFWAAFIIAFPKAFKEKIRFLFIGLVTIFLLNIVRIVALIILTVDMHGNIKYLNSQHDTFNYVVYAVLLSMIYFWIKNHTPNSTKSIIN